MKVLFDGRLIDDKIELSVLDRGLQFGDGLFETIAVRNGKLKYPDYHLERLNRGAKVLSLSLPQSDFKKQLIAVLEENKLIDGTVKLMVWRKTSESRGYSFENNGTHYMISSRVSNKRTDSIIKVAGFAESIRYSFDSLSSIKTMNALPYILAARERQKRKLDELIVLNNEGFICECVSSNIFWKKNNVYYTPPLSSGCLDGVMRRVLIEKMTEANLLIEERLWSKEELLNADSIISSNCNGVRFIATIDNNSFDTSEMNHHLFENL